MYTIQIEENLESKLKKLFKKDRKQYEIIMKRIEKIVMDPYNFKPLRYDMKQFRRVHVAKSFVLIFKIEESKKMIKFIDYDHHDKIYKR